MGGIDRTQARESTLVAQERRRLHHALRGHRTRCAAFIESNSHVWRYRTAAAVLALISVVLELISVMAHDPDDRQTASPWILSVLLAGGYALALTHAFVEQQAAPASQREVIRRQRKSMYSHRAAVVFVMLGLLGVALQVQDSATVVITSAVLISGYINRTCARTGKVATRLAIDLDTVLGLPATRLTATQKLELQQGLTGLAISGRTGLDSGLANGWWGVPGVHPGLLEDIAGSVSVAPLSADLRERLLWQRRALALFVNTGA